MLALLFVSVAVGFDNFGAATALGLGGVSSALRLRVAVVFGLFESAMPIVGLAIGHGVVGTLGGAARPIGGGLLIVAGGYAIATELVGEHDHANRAGAGTARLVLLGAALSIDNLVIGFALSSYHVALAVAAATIGLVSVAMSLVGLELGSRIGARVGSRGELVGGVVLVVVGALVAAGAI